MMRLLTLLAAPLLLAGCADMRLPWGERAPRVEAVLAPADEDASPPADTAAVAPVDVAGQTAAALDRASPGERAAAQAGAGQAGAFLGETLASLGAPGETGFWLVTGLVDQPTQGRIESASGQSVGVELRPSGREPGAGSQISLSAMRALDLPLTSLAPLRVHALR